MIVLGLTGSIGMGKTTAAEIFCQLGVAVFDADRCVHQLYQGRIAETLMAMFPGAVVDGRIDRKALGALVLNDRESMARLESVVHPMVFAERAEFLRLRRASGARLAVLDIPLLFEAGGAREVDAIIVVTASSADQRERVLSRPGMTDEKLAAILSRQIPDDKKRKSAHFIVQTRSSIESTKRQIARIISVVCSFDHNVILKNIIGLDK